MKIPLIAVLLTVPCIPLPALAGSKEIVVQNSGVGGSSEEAAPYLDTFFRYAEKKLGWPANSASGKFYSERDGALAYIAATRPGFGLVEPELWLDLRQKEDLEILATVGGKSHAGHYRIVVKDPALKKLEDLKGKTLVSNHLGAPRFLSKVVFDGKIDAATYFQLQPTHSPLKGLKAVDRGEAAATLLDDEQTEHVKALPFGASLRVIYTSSDLPPTPLVAFVKNTTAAERGAMAKMLAGMCTDPAGAEVCKALQIGRFSPPDTKAFDEAIKRYLR